MSEPEARASRAGPLLLVFPLAFAALAIWWIRQPAATLVPHRPPERADPDVTNEVQGGEVSLGGATLAFWLAPAEPVAERQAFQGSALRQRYGLPEGEPWRLRLEWRAAAAAEPAQAPATLDVGRLSVVDTRGTALAPLLLARELDPLATLLSPPAEPLAVGTSLDLFLWGRAPGEGARLVAPARDGAPGIEVALSARPLRQGERVGPMARLDPPAGGADGKRVAPGASAKPVRGNDDARY